MIKIEENNIIQEKANGWLVALSILIPLAGLIIFLTQKDKQPKTAKISGICALISFIVLIIIISIFTFVIVSTTVMVAGDNGILEKSKAAAAKNHILEAQETVTANVNDATVKYFSEKYSSNQNIDISKYLIDALKKAKRELSEDGISLSASGNKIYLSSDTYKIAGIVSEEGNIKWSDIEEK